MAKVRIDAGHSPKSVNGGKSGYKEHLGMWKLSNYLKEILESYGVQTDLTRAYDADPDLYDRGKMAQGYDLFISEHSNAGGGRGVEVIRDINKPQDEAFAIELTNAVAKVMNTTSRKVMTRTYINNGKTVNYYGVIRGASDTNCKHNFIIENGFHDNITDEAFLKVDSNLQKIAQAQAEVICKYLGVVIPKVQAKTFTKEEAKVYIQQQVILDINSMNFLSAYMYEESLLIKLANAIFKKEFSPIYKNVIIDDLKAVEIIKRATGFSDSTIQYLKDDYKYGSALIQKLAKCMI
jgi:N-acetylmuramoyl-L-alanine amidase